MDFSSKVRCLRLQHAAGSAGADLPYVKAEDLQYFGKLLEAEVRLEV